MSRGRGAVGHEAAAGRGGFSVDPLEVIDPVSLQGLAVPARRWLWENWIPLGAVTILSGDGGTGKSLLALQLATSCAAGHAFLGQTVMRCKALVVACEDERDELHRRQARINDFMEIDFADLEDVRWVSRVGLDNVMMTFGPDGLGETTAFFEQVERLARETGAQLLILDTAADLFGGNENIRGMVRRFIGALARIAIAIDGAVLLLSHPSQAGRAAGSGESGSTAWNNSCRSRLFLTRPAAEEGEAEDRDARVLSRQKANYAAAGEAQPLRYMDGVFVAVGAPVAADDAWTLDRKHKAERAFLDGLEELALKKVRINVHKGQANWAPKAVRDMAKAGEGFAPDELEAAMKRLLKAGRLESVEEGPPSRRRTYLRTVEPDLAGL